MRLFAALLTVCSGIYCCYTKSDGVKYELARPSLSCVGQMFFFFPVKIVCVCALFHDTVSFLCAGECRSIGGN